VRRLLYVTAESTWANALGQADIQHAKKLGDADVLFTTDQAQAEVDYHLATSETSSTAAALQRDWLVGLASKYVDYRQATARIEATQRVELAQLSASLNDQFAKNELDFTAASGVKREGFVAREVAALNSTNMVMLDANNLFLAQTTYADNNRDVWAIDVARGVPSRISFYPGSDWTPVWSPDGTLVAFSSVKGLYLKDASGSTKEELVSEVENGNDKVPSDWSRDGRYLTYTEVDPSNRGDIWYLADPLNKSGDRKPVKFQGTAAIESQGQLSPDGRWLAYTSNESGNNNVYVRPFPSGPGRWKVSGDGENREPRWRRDGKELFFLEGAVGNMRLITVAVQSGAPGDFQAGAPQVLFEFRNTGSGPERNRFLYSPSADGQRFLLLFPQTWLPTVNVISNWEKAALAGK
jgi:Tol biopolymer transport system component